jgi:hypothetical protein
MNKRNIIIIALILIATIIAVIGFSQTNSITKPTQSSSANSTVTTEGEKTYTKEELAKNNGTDQAPCLIAIKNTVYDATKVKSQIKNLPNISGSAPKLECGTSVEMPSGGPGRGPDISKILQKVGVLSE